MIISIIVKDGSGTFTPAELSKLEAEFRQRLELRGIKRYTTCSITDPPEGVTMTLDISGTPDLDEIKSLFTSFYNDATKRSNAYSAPKIEY